MSIVEPNRRAVSEQCAHVPADGLDDGLELGELLGDEDGLGELLGDDDGLDEGLLLGELLGLLLGEDDGLLAQQHQNANATAPISGSNMEIMAAVPANSSRSHC